MLQHVAAFHLADKHAVGKILRNVACEPYKAFLFFGAILLHLPVFVLFQQSSESPHSQSQKVKLFDFCVDH